MKRDYTRGYVGLLALLIVAVIIVFLIAKEYKVYFNAAGSQSATSTLNGRTPIQAAQDAKDLIEKQSRESMEP